ncbi:MAG TPA: RNA polymerase sigma factor [Panacibacter sp.]|nr:RNA polymerase sigma factor [Panacibacter sp.]
MYVIAEIIKLYHNSLMLTDQDKQILQGLKAGYKERIVQEKALYLQFRYFIDEGCRKYSLSGDDSFSAYSDAILSAINNIINDHFDGRSSIKTYLYQIFSNKCIDLVRKNTSNKQSVHQSTAVPELLGQLPDGARGTIEKLINEQKRQAVKIHLETIGEKCKEILLLFEDGLTDREIAEELSYNTAAVAKTTRLRCLEKLRANMSDLIKII